MVDALLSNSDTLTESVVVLSTGLTDSIAAIEFQHSRQYLLFLTCTFHIHFLDVRKSKGARDLRHTPERHDNLDDSLNPH